MQKIKKKYRTVKAVGPEPTNVRTYVRTYKSEFIGSFRSLKTSGEPKNSYEQILRSLPDERTNARTDERRLNHKCSFHTKN